MSNSSQWQKEQDEVATYWFNQIIKYWAALGEDKSKKTNINTEFFLEVYITGSCNQKCKYCYLTEYGEELYPLNIRNEQQILKNYKILLDYLAENHCHLPRLDFFTGEIWGTSFGDKILNLTLYYLVNTDFHVDTIVIPTNYSFCKNKETMDQMGKYIALFKENGSRINLSCSIDGLILDNKNRPKNDNSVKTEEFYDNIFNFNKKYVFGYHPMIAAEGIEYQEENYDSWIEKLHEMYPTDEEFKKTTGIIMQLEVRNGDWTDEKIIAYCKWLNHVIETDIREFYDNDRKLMRDVLLLKDHREGLFGSSYTPYILAGNSGPEGPLPTCTLGHMACIRLGDLAWCPCHRTSYDPFLLGKLKVENNKIIGVEGKNLAILNSIYRTDHGRKPVCDECAYADFCLRGCLGAQYEYTGDIHYPISNVCELQKAKIIFNLEKLKSLGGFDKEQLNSSPLSRANILKNFESTISRTKEYSKWQPIMKKICL